MSEAIVNMTETKTCTSIINLRYQDGIEGSPSNPAKFNNQDFAQLKDVYIQKKSLFVDNTFPPNEQSLGNLPNLTSWQESQVEWLRPADILKLQNIENDATFCKEGASRFDFAQGSVGNCWFLAALSSLTLQKGLFVQVVPMDQTFEDYAGIFHFRFWRFGKWMDVVIDDFLPTINKQLLSVYSKSGNEFWVPLLEKAYAKVCGSYADMNAGLPSEACKDFIGGLNMMYQLQDIHTAGHDIELWNKLSRAVGCKSMICCGTAQKGDVLVNTVAETGIVDGHAYSVTGVTEVVFYDRKVQLVRLMNPWGRKEWNGKWSDKSDMWSRVTPEDREKCFDRNNGEFWMELEDFCKHFKTLFICCENPNFIDGDLTCQWKSMTFDGKWVAGISAGGNVSFTSFETNPQYRMEVTEINREEKADKNIFISLMQKQQQLNRKRIQSYPIGISIFKVPAGTPKGRLGSSFFERNSPIKQTQTYSYQREVIEFHTMEPGEYVIIPSTMKPFMTADFVLTIFSKTETKITSHDEVTFIHDHKLETLILPEIPTNNDATNKDKDDIKDKETITDRTFIRTLFSRYADQHDELKPVQFQKLLIDTFPHGSWNNFGLDTCRSIMTMVDTDLRMTMTFTEFAILWEKIMKYKRHFHLADVDHVGSLTMHQLRRAIELAGMDMDNTMVRMMVFRYSGMTNITIESFVTLMLRLENVTNVFKDKSSEGIIRMSWNEWTNFAMC